MQFRGGGFRKIEISNWRSGFRCLYIEKAEDMRLVVHKLTLYQLDCDPNHIGTAGTWLNGAVTLGG